MTLAENMLPEFDQEMANTRLVLERLPEKAAGWKPHPKSWTMACRSWSSDRLGWRINAVLVSAPMWRRSALQSVVLPAPISPVISMNPLRSRMP